MRFSRTFETHGDINRVFELTKEFFSQTSFQLKNSVKPELLVLSRGDIFGSVLDFNIQNVKTQLTIAFSERSKDVQLRCVYETRYGRIITRRDRAEFESEIDKLKRYLANSPEGE